jgi:hypothetical protein
LPETQVRVRVGQYYHRVIRNDLTTGLYGC